MSVRETTSEKIMMESLKSASATIRRKLVRAEAQAASERRGRIANETQLTALKSDLSAATRTIAELKEQVAKLTDELSKRVPKTKKPSGTNS